MQHLPLLYQYVCTYYVDDSCARALLTAGTFIANKVRVCTYIGQYEPGVIYDPEKEYFCQHTLQRIQYIRGEALGSAIFVYIHTRSFIYLSSTCIIHMFAYLCLCWITF
jgi:hypothetical protein